MKTHLPYMPLGEHFPVAELLQEFTARYDLYRAAVVRWWFSLPPKVRAPYWPGVVLSLVALVLLVSFYQVVSNSVQESEQRHKIAAVYDKASVRCKAVVGQSARDNCLSQIKVLTANAASPSSWNTPGAATLVAGLSDTTR